MTHAGVDGVLGIGPDNGFPGSSAVIPALPGLLNNGVLIDEPAGYLEFGPNPLSAGVWVTGAPITDAGVSVNGGGVDPVSISNDSGGVYGTIPSSAVGTGSPAGTTVPAGTPIAVYTGAGQPLYSYTTTATDGPFVVTGGLMDSGNIPFQLYPIYVGYGPSGVGTTTFDK